ncbi:hypothetical protein [Jiangella mangrovi]|uniref:Uncharacterized protein n=1 Tax=Jiangella mangrovi TaxID=1524084 RepID=A0A7W9GQC5_9ACTN|nr:hypothetical protein [Jiangella mangrovi]MBB5787801.1 hypothetical protein [Jiangella mangrovi]
MAMPRRGRFRVSRRRIGDVLTPAFARDLRGTLLQVQVAASVTVAVALLGGLLIAGLDVRP